MKLQVLTYFVVQICRLISTPVPNLKSESSWKLTVSIRTLQQHEKAATLFRHTESFFRPTLIRV